MIMKWILETFPYVKENPLLVGTFLIIITSILFLIKIESFSAKVNESEDQLAGDADNILTKLLFPMCTALPNFVFAFSALKSTNTAYLVVTANIGNNVTNITLFAGLILFIGLIKGESLSKDEGIELRKDFNFLFISTLIFFVCIWDNILTRQEGFILTICFFYSMAGIFKFQVKDIFLIFKIIFQLAFFFILAGFFIYIGSELIISYLEDIGKNGNSGLYEVLLPGLVLVLPSTLPLLLTITKPQMQKVALSGIIGDCCFSIPLIIGIVSCFSEEISLEKSRGLFNYMLWTSIIAFVCFNIASSAKEKSRTPIWRVFIPFLGYGVILLLSQGGK